MMYPDMTYILCAYLFNTHHTLMIWCKHAMMITNVTTSNSTINVCFPSLDYFDDLKARIQALQRLVPQRATHYLEKVVWGDLLSRNFASFLGRRIKNFEGFVAHFIHLKDSCNIATAVTVIWSAPYGHERIVKHALLAFHDQLMCSADKR